MTEPATARLPEEQPHMLYIADPMCSWCYGFSPIIKVIADHFETTLPLRIMLGGLRAGNTRAMTPSDRDYIRNAWTKVSAATGQPFDHAFFDRESFVYDTEPACRAVVAARRIEAAKALAMKAAISRAFYSANRDTTSEPVLADIAAGIGLDREQHLAEMRLADTRNETFRDFLLAGEMGVQGFPTLLASKGDGPYALVTNGYRPLDGMIEGIERWLASPVSG